MNTLKGIALGLLAIVILAAVGFGINYGNWASTNFFAPKYEATRNKVFQESQAYNEGAQRDLENLMIEYQDADQAHKDLLRQVAIHRFSVYDQNKLSPQLANFYNSLRNGR